MPLHFSFVMLATMINSDKTGILQPGRVMVHQSEAQQVPGISRSCAASADWHNNVLNVKTQAHKGRWDTHKIQQKKMC